MVASIMKLLILILCYPVWHTLGLISRLWEVYIYCDLLCDLLSCSRQLFTGWLLSWSVLLPPDQLG
jgi:hypothetical protein